MSLELKKRKGNSNWNKLKKEVVGSKTAQVKKVKIDKEGFTTIDKQEIKKDKLLINKQLRKEEVAKKSIKDAKDGTIKGKDKQNIDKKNEIEIKKNGLKQINGKSKVEVRVNKKIKIEDKTSIDKKGESKIVKKAIKTKEETSVEPEVINSNIKESTSQLLSQLLLGEYKKDHSIVKKVGKYLAIDCEMVGVGLSGKDSALARVSIVNYYGITIYDTYVKVSQVVTDYRTWVSGILPKHLIDAPTYIEVQDYVSKLIKDKIIIGHGIQNDLIALNLNHPSNNIRDTSKYQPLVKLNNNKPPSLKKLCQNLLGIDIQGAEHSSIEDAQATMAIYRRFQAYWEPSLKVKNKK